VGVTFLSPFALSLGFPFFEEVQGFDRLSPNGFGVVAG